MKLYQALFVIILSCITQILYAFPFQVIPNEELPTQIHKGESTSASYLIKNESLVEIKNNFVKFLPINVKQVTCDANFCGSTFNLAPKGSPQDHCILKLSIKGPVNKNDPDPQHHLLVCKSNGAICNGTNFPLNVIEQDAQLFQAIAAGMYSNQLSQFFPLLAASNTAGQTWEYPKEAFKDLKTTIDPDFLSGLLASTSCSGFGKKSICISSGFYCRDSSCHSQLPLVALGKKQVTQWTYPSQIFQNLTSQIDPNFILGAFNGSGCTGSGGSSVCVASGSYCTDVDCLKQFPLVATTANGGKHWSYPASIFQNLTSSIDPSFVSGRLPYASCTGSGCNTRCVAAGSFCKDSLCNNSLPLLAVSNKNAQNWVYPSDVFSNLSTKIDSDFSSGFFTNASCTGSGDNSICIAPGNFSTSTTTLPLIAVTQDGGKNWSYPKSIFKNLSTTISPLLVSGFFNSGSCAGSGKEAVCIAAGAYFNSKNDIPLIAISRNAGDTWQYPKFIFTKIKTVVDKNFVRGLFSASSCSGLGNDSICIATGYYCTDKNCEFQFPLLALSQNGGKTWTYPTDIFQNLKTKLHPHFSNAFLNGADCKKSNVGSLCTASGQFMADGKVYPLLAVSQDSGNTWSYPTSIFQALDIKVDPNLINASFNSTSTTGGGFNRNSPSELKKYERY